MPTKPKAGSSKLAESSCTTSILKPQSTRQHQSPGLRHGPKRDHCQHLRQWIRTNVVPFYPKTKIRYVLVGNEILSFQSLNSTVWPALVPAMRLIKHALKSFKINNVKVGTTLTMDSLEAFLPPSSGNFRSDIESTKIQATKIKRLDSRGNRDNGLFLSSRRSAGMASPVNMDRKVSLWRQNQLRILAETERGSP
ncbi:hypothetical protein QQ045_022950 [Rhodiola kirilowii]